MNCVWRAAQVSSALRGSGRSSVLTHSASQRTAVAGYYQGLKSVRERGMFPDTKRYVANILALKKQFGGR